jgi:UMF1 family MFS transporter
MPGQKKITKEQWSWAFYDWANSAFATTVMAGFFPLFYKSYWASSFLAQESTAILGTINSIAGLIIMFLAPILHGLVIGVEKHQVQ